MMLLLLVIVLASAGVRRPATRRPVAPRTSPAVSRVASSTLSRQVAVAVTPDLEAEFRDVGVTFGGPLYIRAFKYDTAKAALLFESLSGAKGPVAQRNTENRNMNSQYYSGSSIEIWAKRTDSEVFELFKSYPVCMYSGKLGPKQREGDMMTPEGIYDVVPSSFNPFSSYRLSFNVGYPNQYDKLKRRTGGSVMVHGICGSVGCFAMDDLIDEIFTLVSVSAQRGQSRIPMHIFPFPLQDATLAAASAVFPQHVSFWRDELKPVFDAFEGAARKIPPTVIVDTSAGAPVYKLFQ